MFKKHAFAKSRLASNLTAILSDITHEIAVATLDFAENGYRYIIPVIPFRVDMLLALETVEKLICGASNRAFDGLPL